MIREKTEPEPGMKTYLIVLTMIGALAFTAYRGGFAEGSWIGVLAVPLIGIVGVALGYVKFRMDRKRREGERF